jgi:hypothetical protein
LTNISEEVAKADWLRRSDHVVIITKLKVGDSKEEREEAPEWRRADCDGIHGDLRSIN